MSIRQTLTDYYQLLSDEGLTHKAILDRIAKEAAEPPPEAYEKWLEKAVRAEWTNERANNTDMQTMLSSIMKALLVPMHEDIIRLEHEVRTLETKLNTPYLKEEQNGEDGRIPQQKGRSRSRSNGA